MSTTASEPAVLDDCFRCGYDLRGIANDQACPECGLLAERSRRVTDELHDSRPRWLRKLAMGTWMILASILIAFSWLVVAAAFEYWFYAGVFTARSRWHGLLTYAARLAGFDLAALVLLVGVVLVTSKEGYAPADDADRKRRRWLRLAAALPFVLLLVQHNLDELDRIRMVNNYTGGHPSDPIPDFIRPVMHGLASIPLPILLFAHLRSIAKRARSAHLAEHCMIVGVGTTLSLLYLALVAVFSTVGDRLGTYWIERSSVWLTIELLLFVAAGLFLFWSVYLMIRFAIAFGKASRKRRRKWKLHDRAAEAGGVP